MDIFIQISRERLQIFWIMKMEMLLPDWEKKEMNVEKAKEKAQINNLSKFSDNQIHWYTILADSVYHESGNTTIPEYLTVFLRTWIEKDDFFAGGILESKM